MLQVIAEVRDFLLSLSADPKSEANLIGHVFSPVITTFLHFF